VLLFIALVVGTAVRVGRVSVERGLRLPSVDRSGARA